MGHGAGEQAAGVGPSAVARSVALTSPSAVAVDRARVRLAGVTFVRRLRWLRIVYHLAFVGMFVLAIAVSIVIGMVPPIADAALLSAIVGLFVIGLLAQGLVWRTRCPRCGETFFRRAWSPNQTWAGFPTDRRCVHCGLTIVRR